MTRPKRKTVGQRAIAAMWRALPPRRHASGPDVVKRAAFRVAYLRGYLAGWRAAKREFNR